MSEEFGGEAGNDDGMWLKKVKLCNLSIVGLSSVFLGGSIKILLGFLV